ncbi:hypothetical protein XENTR_v10017041 [Xenopus tropicalis]|nr:hypothetical protein XENTR_v10017041 [Xenopus tropicalis]
MCQGYFTELACFTSNHKESLRNSRRIVKLGCWDTRKKPDGPGRLTQCLLPFPRPPVSSPDTFHFCMLSNM